MPARHRRTFNLQATLGGLFTPRREDVHTREDREDREALERARADLDAGKLDTVSNADLKARLGLD